MYLNLRGKESHLGDLAICSADNPAYSVLIPHFVSFLFKSEQDNHCLTNIYKSNAPR